MENTMKSITTKFISHFISDEKTSLLIGNDFWEKDSEMFLRNKEKQIFTGLFDFNSLKKDSHKNFIEYFQNEDSKKYDLIIAELPFGLKKSHNEELNLSIAANWEMIYALLKSIKSGGTLLVGIEPNFGTTHKSKQFLKLLSEKSFYLSALIETPQNILAPLTTLQPNIAIFTKQNNEEKIFISSLDETDNEEIAFNNFIKNKNGNNLIEGDIIELNNFKGFYNYRINKKTEKLQTQYKEFKVEKIKNISTEINIT